MTDAAERFRLAPEDIPLLTAVVLLPWAFGGVELWAYRTAALLLVLAAGIALWRGGWEGWGLGRSHETSWLLPSLLLVAWACVQLVPLPPRVVGLLSPEAYRIYTDSIPRYGGDAAQPDLVGIEDLALEQVPEADGTPFPSGDPPGPAVEMPRCFEGSWHSLSLQPTATTERLFWFVALLLGFLVTRRRVSDPHVYRFYRWTLFGLFGALTLFGLLQMQTWNGHLYWIRPMTTKTVVFGPYVNPTNYAWVMELAIPWFAGYALSRLRRYGRGALRHARLGLAVLGVAVGLVATVMAASKAGVALAVTALFLVTIAAVPGWRLKAGILAVWIALAVASPLVLSRTRLGVRFEEYTTSVSGVEVGEGRVSSFQAALRMVADYPATGVGFGAFREVFPRYMPAGATRWWDEAHNDYLELATDGGLVAVGLVLWLGWGYAVRVWKRLRRGGRQVSLCRVGLAFGIIAMAIHGIADFNHQIPANALLFVTACAMLLPAVDRERELEEDA